MKRIKCQPRENAKYIDDRKEFEEKLGISSTALNSIDNKRTKCIVHTLMEEDLVFLHTEQTENELNFWANTRNNYMYLGTWKKQFGRKLIPDLIIEEYVEYYYYSEINKYIVYIITKSEFTSPHLQMVEIISGEKVQ